MCPRSSDPFFIVTYYIKRVPTFWTYIVYLHLKQGPTYEKLLKYTIYTPVTALLQDGIAVNAIWPRTAIITAAMEMLGGGGEVAAQCRVPEIMADAAYVILTRDSRTFTGTVNTFIEESNGTLKTRFN